MNPDAAKWLLMIRDYRRQIVSLREAALGRAQKCNAEMPGTLTEDEIGLLTESLIQAKIDLAEVEIRLQ